MSNAYDANGAGAVDNPVSTNPLLADQSADIAAASHSRDCSIQPVMAVPTVPFEQPYAVTPGYKTNTVPEDGLWDNDGSEDCAVAPNDPIRGWL